MAMKKKLGAKPELALVAGEVRNRDVGPPGLEQAWREFYQDLIDEVIAIRGAATTADIALIRSCAEAAQGEAEAREFAAEAKDQRSMKNYLAFTKLAESQLRSKSAALGCLGLSGDRRGIAQVRQAAHAAKSGATTAGSQKDEWNDL